MMHYHIGTCLYLLNDFEGSAKHLEHFLEHVQGKQFRPYVAFMLGVDYWFIGRKDEIEPLYRKIAGWARPNQSFDEYAQKKAQLFFDKGNAFDEFESIFLPAYGLHHGLEYEQALKKLEKAVPLLKADKSEANRDRHAQFYWLKGSCLRHLGKIEKSKKFLEKAVEQD